MPQKKVKLTPAGPPGTPGRQSTLTKAGNALSKAKKRATENATKPSVKSLGARLDQAAANEKRAATREANKAAKAAAQAAAQAELDKTRKAHLDQHNTYHQIHRHISDITNSIADAHINGNHEDLVGHAEHLVSVLHTHKSALEARGSGGSHHISDEHIEHVKGLLRKVGKDKEVSPDLRAKAKRIANDHLTRHVPDVPKAAPRPRPIGTPKAAKPGIVDRIRSVFAEEYELHEDYGAGDVGTDEVVRKYKSMTPGEQKNEVKLSESYVLWLEEQEQLDEILNMMRDYHRAWNLHVRAEQKRNNPLAKHGVLGPTVAGIAAYASGPVAHHIAHAVHHLANGNIEEAAVHGVAASITGGLALHVIGGHARETHKIFNKLRAQRKQNPVMTTESTHIDNHLEKAHEIVKHHGKEDEIEKMIKILKSRKSTRR